MVLVAKQSLVSIYMHHGNNHDHRPVAVLVRGGVEDTRLEAKAKDTKKIRGQGQGQGQPFRGHTLSRPRTGMLEAKAKDQGHSRKRSPKKKVFKHFFRRSPIYKRTQNFRMGDA